MANHCDIGKKFEHDLKFKILPRLKRKVLLHHKDRLSQRSLGDFQIEVIESGQVKEIDAKAEWLASGNFPIEIMQDWKTCDHGWYLHLFSHEVWYGRYDRQSAKLVDVHVIDLQQVRRLPVETTKQWRVARTTKGQGDTILVLAPLDELIAKGCAEEVQGYEW